MRPGTSPIIVPCRFPQIALPDYRYRGRTDSQQTYGVDRADTASPRIGITVTAKAYAAIKATLPADTQTWPTSPGDQGDVVIWLDQATVDRLAAMAAQARATATLSSALRGAQNLRRRKSHAGRAYHR